MKILLIHPNPLEDYHLERLVDESFRSLEHEVVSIRYRDKKPDALEKELKKKSSKVDFALILKGELLEQKHYDAIECFSGLWYVDHPKDNKLPDWLILGSRNVDYVFASSYAALQWLEKYNENCNWLVEGAHLPLLQPVEEEKQYDLSFFGTLIAETNNGDKFGERWEFLNKIDKSYDLHVFGVDSNRSTKENKLENAHGPVWNEQLAKEIAKSKIVLGYNSTNKEPFYWSNRTYTTLACKGFLITPYVPGLERVFENHKELVWFYSEEEFYKLIDYYLKNDVQRRQIAEQGYKKVCALFSTEKQVEKLVGIVEDRIQTFGKKKKLLFLTDAGYVGCLNAVEHWAALLRSEGVAVKHLVIEEPIATSICNKFDTVIVSGYSGIYATAFESSSKKYVIWQSSILQTQLEKEVKPIKLIKQLEKEKKIDGVICGDNNTMGLFSNPIWVPNFSFFRPHYSSYETDIDKSKINIAALGPSKARKNLYTVLAAIERLNDSHVLHINVSKEFYEENIEGIFDTRKIVNHGWLEREDYCALIRRCNMGVQLSVAESYDYVAAEHMLLGTPIICSKSVPAITVEDLLVNNPENSGELLAKFDVVKRATKEQKTKWFEEFKQKDKLRLEKAKQQLMHHIVGKRSSPIITSNCPLLSIVYHGRNDNYAGEFKRRLSWSLQTVQKAFKNIQPEILFVCWNDLPNSPSLFDDPLFKGKISGIKVYRVPSQIHNELADKFGYNGVYLEWFAKNFGLRRATGEYILQLNSDNIIVNKIFPKDLPPKDVTYIGNRTEVKKSILDYAPEKINTKLLKSLSGRLLETDIDRPYYVGGSCGEFVLSHRDNWYKICGNVEVTGRYCIDNVTATHLRMVSRLETFKYPIYHIAHRSAPGVWPGFDFELGYSGPDWGLSNVKIEPEFV